MLYYSRHTARIAHLDGRNRKVVRRAAAATYEAEMNIVIFTDEMELKSKVGVGTHLEIVIYTR